VALARAFAIEPAVLLLDEPLGALDALTRATLQGELARIWAEEKRTVVMVTNDIDEAVLLADRIVPLCAVKGSGSTLGPEIAVDLPRPRDRKLLADDDRAREIRGAVRGYLRGDLAARRAA
jgi:nitrate/nitrite transport system ATP-binding protein